MREQYVGRVVRDFAKREGVVVATKFRPSTEDEIAAGISIKRRFSKLFDHLEGYSYYLV